MRSIIRGGDFGFAACEDFFCRHAARIAPLRALVHFSCVPKRNGTTNASGTRLNGEAGPKGGGQEARSKEKGTPVRRPSGAFRAAGFPRRAFLARGKMTGIPAGHPAGLVLRAPPPTEGIFGKSVGFMRQAKHFRSS